MRERRSPEPTLFVVFVALVLLLFYHWMRS